MVAIYLNELASLHPNAEVVGHSLGGGIASAFGTAHKRTTTTFNSSGINSATLDLFGISEKEIDGFVTAYYVEGDILSGLQDNTTLQEAIPWYLAKFLKGKDLTPNAKGIRRSLFPDLKGDFDDGEILSFLENLSLSVQLHGMQEVIQAIDLEIERCCKD
ncbi:MAG: hypothetical protein KDC45_14085 [Bacteroidetes bacterium]|nr:hypothetical protein [Bacteroidota bacterium]